MTRLNLVSLVIAASLTATALAAALLPVGASGPVTLQVYDVAGRLVLAK